MHATPAMVSITQLITIFVFPFTVLACEGECISGTTNEYLKLYASPVNYVMQDMADKIANECVPPENRRQNSMSYIAPLIKAYDKASYNGLEHAIFPSYFHGKCLYPNGTVPHGCPNPDCPVVCGTPGSMVHFFPILTRIVFDYILGELVNITSPENKPFEHVKKLVAADTQKARRSDFSWAPRSAKLQARRTTPPGEKRLRAIMKEAPTTMLKACGGFNLSSCCWEKHMKKFILQYP